MCGGGESTGWVEVFMHGLPNGTKIDLPVIIARITKSMRPSSKVEPPILDWLRVSLFSILYPALLLIAVIVSNLVESKAIVLFV